jgi:hypothetical protein
MAVPMRKSFLKVSFKEAAFEVCAMAVSELAQHTISKPEVRVEKR